LPPSYYPSQPDLKPYFNSIFADCYTLARKKAAVETGLPIETFPETALFTPESALNPDFLPDA
jgi:hypothetical protein